MSSVQTGGDVAQFAERKTKAVASLWRRGRVARALLLLPVVAAVIVLGVLYERPAHEYQMDGNTATWAADVKIAVSESRAGSPVLPTGPLDHLPGVGGVDSVVVDKQASGKREMVIFSTDYGGNAGGLVYLRGFPPPPDTCNYHLGGPWWQLSPLNVTTNACARGFHYTAGG